MKKLIPTCPISPTCVSIRSSAQAGPTTEQRWRQQYFDWFKYQFWRFVFVQQTMAKEIQSFLDFPPMQRGASFNLDAVKAEMAKKMEAAEKGSQRPEQLIRMVLLRAALYGSSVITIKPKIIIIFACTSSGSAE